MLNAANFKINATLFRKAAKEMELPFSLCQLLNIYAYAHYGRVYSAAHHIANKQLLPLPTFPPPYLSKAAERYDLDEAQILNVLEKCDINSEASATYATEITGDPFKWAAKCFRAHASDLGIKLKMTAMNDLFSSAHFNRPYSVIVGLLNSSNAEMNLDKRPAFFDTACAFYHVDPDIALEAFHRVAQDTIAQYSFYNNQN